MNFKRVLTILGFCAIVSGILWAQTAIRRPQNPQDGFSPGVSHSNRASAGSGDTVSRVFAGELLIEHNGAADSGPRILLADLVNNTWDIVSDGRSDWKVISTDQQLPDTASDLWSASGTLIFEGATADAVETIISAGDQATGDATFQFPNNNAAADTYNVMFSLLDTNALQVANSVWFDSGAMIFEGASADASETTISAADATADATWQLVARSADTYHVTATPDGDSTSGYFLHPDMAHTADAAFTSGGDNTMYCYRLHLPHPLRTGTVQVGAEDLVTAAGTDFLGAAIYNDADAGTQITEGATAFSAASATSINTTDVTIYPGFYRFCFCSSDATNLGFTASTNDDEAIDVYDAVSAIQGTAANACTGNADAPATTGAITTADVPLIIFKVDGA